MEYYSKLRDKMKLIDAHKLCDWFASAEIIAHDNVRSYVHAYGPDKILTKVASHLLNGKTYVLYIMFETLQNHSDLFHNLVSEIQVTLDQKLQTGK